MNITTELYTNSLKRWPATGQHILAHQKENMMVVYQAYKHSIADYAVKEQRLGGADFSFNRMSWIKPNFLWMMYRCGWCSKGNQERVLALWIEKSSFEEILSKATFSSFKPEHYASHEHWKKVLAESDVRLQWDPDHDPYGNKVERRAIQLGLKDKALESFCNRQVKQIEDVTDFVKQQGEYVKVKQLDKLVVPYETVYISEPRKVQKRAGIDTTG